MKKTLIAALACAVLLSMTTLAQSNNFLPKGDKDSGALKTVKGTVKAEGDKVMFVSDKDRKSWDVMNPETLKGHEGHHVELKAHVYPDKNSIHVMEVKMLSAKGDSMGKSDSMGKDDMQKKDDMSK
ncbi:MAG: hypothetical protein JO187_12180 [Acidobacteria bacterium]|nr:hypothetical protein [Acidobacteriota bacterium]